MILLLNSRSRFSFAFFMYPIGASGNDPGRIDFKPGANPSTTPFFEGGLHLLKLKSLVLPDPSYPHGAYRK